MEYNPKQIELKWRKYWEDNSSYKVEIDKNKPKFYVLDMFPYPSGAGLHVGHPLGYIASDIYARYKRQKGFNVLHPMGYDAFGLPAEQYAIDTGNHPGDFTQKNIEYFTDQLKNLGFSFDWDRSVATSDPGFYKWTQWIFILLFKSYYDNDLDKAVSIEGLIEKFEKEGNINVNAASSYEVIFTNDEWNAKSDKEKDSILMEYRLAYRKVGYVNWCEILGTVLANDEVKDGFSERGGHPVIQKPLLQWSLRTTAYAQRLLDGLDTIDWPTPLKTQQQNWIGRSEGAKVFFDIQDSERKLEIFTTRPDTIFGATFMVLAPEHDWIAELTTGEQLESIKEYQKYVSSRSERDRVGDVKTVTGAFTGAYAINPFNNVKVPIWISEYVLKDYGTGAIMAVPSDDDRDKAFATKFDIPIIDVVDKSDYPGATLSDKVGKMINSDFITGLEVKDAIEAVLVKIEENNIGERKINYKLRDASFSRQRYWGEPIPVEFNKDEVASTLSFDQLPLELPKLDNYKPSADGHSPLRNVKEWYNPSTDVFRETDTLPGYAGSSWYFLRYIDPHNPDAFASNEALNYWQDVDLYIGGSEHAVGHLLYSRVWHKVLFDLGYVPTHEPFKKLINQGMIQGIIEFIYLKKEKTNDGLAHFVSADAPELYSNDIESIVKIPVMVSYVKDYGNTSSYLDKESIDNFIAWRPEYKTAIFENKDGIYQNGKYTSKSAQSDFKIFTLSETGKMSKSKFNTIDPNSIIEKYGIDCFRMYEMFLGPITDSKPWNTLGITGVQSFLRKFWAMMFNADGQLVTNNEAPSKEEYKILHTLIKKVNQDVEKYAFNTCISSFMSAINDLKKIKSQNINIIKELISLISPFAPHIASEAWSNFNFDGQVLNASYPVFDEKHLVESEVEYPVCINGKKRSVVSFDANLPKDDIIKLSLELPEIKKWTDGKTIKKVIVVPNRMVNVVIG